MSANASGWQATTCGEAAGGEFPVRLRVAHEVGQGRRAAQALVDAGAAGQQGIAGRGPAGAALPDDLPARRLQAQGELDCPAHRGPHPRHEPGVPGHQVLVPDAHGHVGGVVALAHVIADPPVRRGPPGPGPVRPLRGQQPLVGPPGRAAQPAHRQRHGALDVVPRIHQAIRPADRPGLLLPGGDGLAGSTYLRLGQDAGHGWDSAGHGRRVTHQMSCAERGQVLTHGHAPARARSCPRRALRRRAACARTGRCSCR